MKRLNKAIAEAGITSRRKADNLIKSGRVKVNGVVVKELGTLVTSKDDIEVSGVLIEKQLKKYFLLNKPRRIISAVKDDRRRKTVIDLIDPEDRDVRLFPVGRLDYQSTGLIIITNDGELANKLAHPSREVEKEYRVVINQIINKKTLLTLNKGVIIDENFLAIAKKIRFIKHDNDKKQTTLEMVITEGRNHQVRKMIKAIGGEVVDLMRIRYDFLTTKSLAFGKYRELKPHEIKKLMR